MSENSQDKQPAGQLPFYITSAIPNPPEKRAPWYSNTAPTYAGIFLWFVFWQESVNAPNAGGMLSHGVGWVGVNIYAASQALAPVIPFLPKPVIMVIWGVLAGFVGLKGIQYVAKVATYLPLIPLVILLILFAKTAGTIGGFDSQKFIDLHKGLSPQTPAALSAFGVMAFMMTYVVGFFATAGAAGVDFGTNSRDKKDVQMGGLIGIALAITVTAGIWLLVVAGTYGSPEFSKAAVRRHRHGGEHCAGHYRLGWQSNHRFPDHRRFFRPHLRRDDGGLPFSWRQMVRSARGLQSGWLGGLAGRFRSGHPA